MFSPGVCWSGLTLNLSGCEVQALRTNSYGVKPLRSLEASSEVVGVDEVAQMGAQLVVRLVEVAFDGCVLDGAVHAFDLAVGPSVLGLRAADGQFELFGDSLWIRFVIRFREEVICDAETLLAGSS